MKRRILIVEDEIIIAEDIKKILSKHNFDVIDIIPSGTEAVDRIQNALPDTILMDIMLDDDINGIDVALQIKDLNIPVIFLTAFADAEKIEKAKLTEPFGYLIKPFRERELIATLEMALYKHSIEKRMLETLRDYQRIFENIQDIYFEMDTNGNILQISPSLQENSSYTIEELIGTQVRDIVFYPDDIDAFISKLTKDLVVKDYPLCFKDVDGSQIMTTCSAKFIIDKYLEKSKIVGSFRNITDTMQSKTTLKNNTNTYRKLFETIMDAVVIYGKDGFIDCNEAALQLFGIPKKNFFIGTHPEDFSPRFQPDGRLTKELTDTITKEVFEMGNKNFTWVFRKYNGDTFRAKVWLSATDFAGKRVIQTTIKDLSKLDSLQQKLQIQQAEIEAEIHTKTSALKQQISALQLQIEAKDKIIAKIKEDEEFNNTLFDNIPVETIVVNKKGEIIRYNLAVKKNRSHPPGIGDRMYIDYADKHKIDMFGNLIDTIRKKVPRNFSNLVYKDKIWDITIAPYEHGAIISSQNVTAQKQAEQQLMQLNGVFEKMGPDSQRNIDIIIQEVCRILNSNCSFLSIRDDNNGALSVFSSCNLPAGMLAETDPASLTCIQDAENNLFTIEDIETSKFKDQAGFAVKFGLKSYMSYPVHSNGNMIGSLCMLYMQPKKFTDKEKHIFTTLAKVISIELERMQFANSLKKISMTQKLMLHTARQINSSLDFREVAKRITKEAMELLNAYGSVIYLLKEDAETLEPIVVIDPEFEKEIYNTPIRVDNSYTGKAILYKKVMVFNETDKPDNGFHIPGTSELPNERILAAPLVSEDKVFGAICLNKIGAKFTSADLEIVEILANHAANALKNAETFEKLQHEMQERMQAELQRDESLSQLKSLQSNVPVGIFRSTPKGKLISVNKSFITMFGYHLEKEVLAVNTASFYVHAIQWQEVMDKLAQEGEVDDMELQLKRQDNSHFWALISIKAVFDKNKKWIYQDGIINDITKRKQAEENLQKTQMRLATVFDNVPNILLFETGGRKEFISENVEKLLGYPAERFTRDPQFYFSLIHQDELEYVQKKYEEWKKGGRRELLTFWCRIRKADGDHIWIEDRRVESEDFWGNKFESGVRIDITNLKNADEELKQSYEKLQKLLAETVNGLVSAVEMRDPYTAGHQRRVAILATAIAEKMGMDKNDVEGLNLASLVHDIGKINVPAEILSKPGRLTDTEFNLIKTHPQTGYDILKSIEFPWPVAEIVLQHQERYDGSSYPQGLKGDEINIFARILCVADVMEAMSSHRPYRPSLGIDIAIEEIKKNRGILYDPNVVDACMDLFEKDGFQFTE